MKHKTNNYYEAGMIKFTTAIVTAVFGTAFYLALKTGVFYYDYYVLIESARDTLDLPYKRSNEDIAKRFYNLIQKTGVPFDLKDVKVTQNGSFISLKVTYYEYLTLFDKDLHEFKFVLDEERDPK